MLTMALRRCRRNCSTLLNSGRGLLSIWLPELFSWALASHWPHEHQRETWVHTRHVVAWSRVMIYSIWGHSRVHKLRISSDQKAYLTFFSSPFTRGLFLLGFLNNWKQKHIWNLYLAIQRQPTQTRVKSSLFHKIRYHPLPAHRDFSVFGAPQYWLSPSNWGSGSLSIELELCHILASGYKENFEKTPA